MRLVRATHARWLAGGVAAAMLYLGMVTLAWPYPVRLLYDGLVPLPPYRWVHPPADRAKDNRQPLSGSGTIALGPPSRPAEISTEDDQALVTFPEGIIAPRSGEASVKITIVPLNPATIAPAPGGRRFDGNAYRIEASYSASGEAAALAASVTVVLRYPVHATIMLRSADPGWTPLAATVFDGSQQILANTDRLGVFAAAALSNARGVRFGTIEAGFLAAGGAVAGLIGTWLARRR